MKISELWLREWVSPKITREQLSWQLTMAGLEVEAITPVAPEFTHAVVARVIQTSPHPDANKLTVCEVDAGLNEPLSVVCGAHNVRAGLVTVLALPGAMLPNNIHIKETSLRGVRSQGMLCSALELGLENQSDGIMELPDDAPIGELIYTYLQLADVVFEVSLTPNRADCLSVLGMAREVAALNKLPLPTLTHPQIISKDFETKQVLIHDTGFCPRYCARVIRGISLNKKTPLWMEERLRRSSIRPIHPVVDITNYVMLELGQPLHAFDVNSVAGDIVVRAAVPGESIVLLNGQTHALQKNTMVIADDNGALAIAGIMGGEIAAVKEGTIDIWIESAYFNARDIAGVARKYGLCTDASQRYERGVDPALPAIALDRAAALITEFLGGEVSELIIHESLAQLPVSPTIVFDPQQVFALTGLKLDALIVADLLKSIGLNVDISISPWRVTTPSYRVDLSCAEDLVEEVARLHGYEHIPTVRTIAPLIGGTENTTEMLMRKMRSFWSAQGYSETINFSFVDPEVQAALFPEQPAMTLLNPISSELSTMRLSLWPGLIASFIHNIHRQQSSVKIFECGTIFEGLDVSLKERPVIAGLLAGMCNEYHWQSPTRAFGFYDLKETMQQFLHSFGLKGAVFSTANHPALHPGQTARIEYQGSVLGWMGLIHPKLAELFDWDQDVFVFEFMMDIWPNKPMVQYRSVSKFPKIRRDLALIAAENIVFSQIETCIRNTIKPEWLKSLFLFDVYRGPSIPEGKKSLAVTLTFQDDNRTLIDDEIKEQMDAIIRMLSEELSVSLRE